MCGIYGCVKSSNTNTDIKKLLLQALNLLKNRGYDSFGIFLNDTAKDPVCTTAGMLFYFYGYKRFIVPPIVVE
jgi:glucosamine 6-phosphate synthetase-like amidotransferase/phosphosugar isomerase protein